MRSGERGDIARCRIETKNRPALGNGLIAVPCHEPRAADRIEIELDAGKVGRQADAQRFNRGLLVRPQGKERISLRRSLQTVQGSAFRRCKIGLRNVDGPRQITDLLYIDADGVIESHCDHAAIAAVRNAELKLGTICSRKQIWLAIPVAGKGECRGACFRIVGEYLSHAAMCLDETHPVMLERELRGPCPLLSAQQWQQGSCDPMVVDEACCPHVDFADGQARTIFAERCHIACLASDAAADANKSWMISRARAAGAAEK